MTISRPIEGDTALIDRHGQPGGETVETTVAVEATPDTTAYGNYAEWSEAARPYFLDQAGKPGAFTTFEALAAAPRSIREPANPHWPGRLTIELHDDGTIAYALDEHGTERWSKSRRPKTAKSGVRMWVGTAAKVVAP